MSLLQTDFNLKLQDLVTINLEQVKANGFNPIVNPDELFIISRQYDIGEPAYNVRSEDTGARIYLSEDKEYAFVDEELTLVASKESYS